MPERTMPINPYATEGNLAAVLLDARFAGGIAASGQRAGFGGNLFTRDACRMMRDTMDKYPSMTRELLSTLPQMQGVTENPATNEFPNSMPHQTFRQIVGGRRLPDSQVESAEHWTSIWGVGLQHSQTEGKWFTVYNSSDGPLLYLITLAEFSRLPEGKDVMRDEFLHRPSGETRTVGEAGRRCVDSIMHFLERSEERGSGLYVVPNTNPRQTSPSGVMRDGFDAYYYPEGDAGKPLDYSFVAYIDNQALAYEALMVAADELYPDDDHAAEWRAKAEGLRRRSLEAFWMEDAQFFAAAIDEQGRQVRLESNAAAELLNGPFLDVANGPEYVRSLVKWLYGQEVMTPIGPRMLSQKFDRFEGDYYAYQGSGAVWPYVNGLIAKGLRKWELYGPSYDLGVNRTLGLLNRTRESVEVAYVDRESNEPLYDPYAPQIRPLGAVAIAAEPGQLDQGWTASAGLRELWDWRRGIPDERPGSWQRAVARQALAAALHIPAASEGRITKDYCMDTKAAKGLKQKRSQQMGVVLQ